VFEVIVGGAVELFFEDGVLVDGFKLGLEVAESLGAAVGAAALVDKVVPIVLRLFSGDAPACVSKLQ